MHQDLLDFLEEHLPKKKKKVLLGVNDSRLGASIAEKFPGIRITFSGVISEILRGIRTNFHHLSKGLPHASLNKAQLSLGHCYSRAKVIITNIYGINPNFLRLNLTYTVWIAWLCNQSHCWTSLTRFVFNKDTILFDP